MTNANIKQQAREDLEAQLAAFLAEGKAVQAIPTGKKTKMLKKPKVKFNDASRTGYSLHIKF